MEIELRINGVIESVDAAANETLLSLLRREGQYSVKQGCETGHCGACTVLVDGVPRPSCVMLAAQAGGCTLTTVEGLGTLHKLHPLQEAFIEVGAVQCGYCTPGMLLSAHALLQRNDRPTESEIRDALSGNLCHCTGYQKPVQAVMRAAANLRGEGMTAPEIRIVRNEDAGKVNTKNRIPAVKGTIGPTTAKIPSVMLSPSSLPVALQNGALDVVGQSVQGIDADRLVTGMSAFTADFSRREMLYGRILTSPHAHAIIRDIDVSEAKSLAGVHAVLTYKDVPRIAYSSVERALSEEGPYDQYSLDYLMRYVGDRVAVVAAETPEIAEQALRLIQVEYDVLPAVLDARLAADQSAPRIHPESETRGIYDAARNIVARVGSEVGDVEHGFTESDVIVEEEYLVPPVHEAAIEGYSVVTYVDEDDRLVVRTSTQAPDHIRRTLARLLGLPVRRIHVVKPVVGDGFGTQQGLVLEDACALLTMATSRPVMLAYTPSQSFSSGPHRQQYILRLKSGVKRDGTLVARQVIVLANSGAYGTHPLNSLYEVPAEFLALYPAPHMRYVTEILYTNLPPSGAFRGYGPAQELFALECHMDEIARQIKMDALELRRRSWLKAGDAYPLANAAARSREVFPQINSCGLPECLRLVEEKLQWRAKRGKVSNERLRHGVGIALSLSGSPASVGGTSGAMMKLNEDGSFDLFTGANSASDRTLLAQIAAETLSVPIANIALHSSDSDTTPISLGESAKAVLYLHGGAVKQAAEQLRRQLLAVAGRLLSVMPESLKMKEGIITNPNGASLTIEQVAAASLYVENRQLMTTASWKMLHAPTTFGVQGVEVEVDVETGVVRVLDVVTAIDAGYAINPMIAEAQIQGAIARGLSLSISEEMLYNQKGGPVFTSLGDYRTFNAVDMPELHTSLVETIEPDGPYGAKEIADIALLGIAPALVNAVNDALNLNIRQIPLTPERVLRAIHAQQAAKN
jgi:putative selenate reductase molybdopterin-binding subunit